MDSDLFVGRFWHICRREVDCFERVVLDAGQLAVQGSLSALTAEFSLFFLSWEGWWSYHHSLPDTLEMRGRFLLRNIQKVVLLRNNNLIS